MSNTTKNTSIPDLYIVSPSGARVIPANSSYYKEIKKLHPEQDHRIGYPLTVPRGTGKQALEEITSGHPTATGIAQSMVTELWLVHLSALSKGEVRSVLANSRDPRNPAALFSVQWIYEMHGKAIIPTIEAAETIAQMMFRDTMKAVITIKMGEPSVLQGRDAEPRIGWKLRDDIWLVTEGRPDDESIHIDTLRTDTLEVSHRGPSFAPHEVCTALTLAQAIREQGENQDKEPNPEDPILYSFPPEKEQSKKDARIDKMQEIGESWVDSKAGEPENMQRARLRFLAACGRTPEQICVDGHHDACSALRDAERGFVIKDAALSSAAIFKFAAIVVKHYFPELSGDPTSVPEITRLARTREIGSAWAKAMTADNKSLMRLYKEFEGVCGRTAAEMREDGNPAIAEELVKANEAFHRGKKGIAVTHCTEFAFMFVDAYGLQKPAPKPQGPETDKDPREAKRQEILSAFGEILNTREAMKDATAAFEKACGKEIPSMSHDVLTAFEDILDEHDEDPGETYEDQMRKFAELVVSEI